MTEVRLTERDPGGADARNAQDLAILPRRTNVVVRSARAVVAPIGRALADAPRFAAHQFLPLIVVQVGFLCALLLLLVPRDTIQQTLVLYAALVGLSSCTFSASRSSGLPAEDADEYREAGEWLLHSSIALFSFGVLRFAYWHYLRLYLPDVFAVKVAVLLFVGLVLLLPFVRAGTFAAAGFIRLSTVLARREQALQRVRNRKVVASDRSAAAATLEALPTPTPGDGVPPSNDALKLSGSPGTPGAPATIVASDR